jgi:hypothetical protein
MSLQKINPRFTVILLFIIAVAAVRIPNATQLAPWANFTPIGAMGLFGGAYFTKKWKAILFPLLTLFISDLVIQLLIFKGQYGIMYGGWYWIYGIFVLITFIGKTLIKKVTVVNVLIAAVAASLLCTGIPIHEKLFDGYINLWRNNVWCIRMDENKIYSASLTGNITLKALHILRIPAISGIRFFNTSCDSICGIFNHYLKNYPCASMKKKNVHAAMPLLNAEWVIY